MLILFTFFGLFSIFGFGITFTNLLLLRNKTPKEKRHLIKKTHKKEISFCLFLPFVIAASFCYGEKIVLFGALALFLALFIISGILFLTVKPKKPLEISTIKIKSDNKARIKKKIERTVVPQEISKSKVRKRIIRNVLSVLIFFPIAYYLGLMTAFLISTATGLLLTIFYVKDQVNIKLANSTDDNTFEQSNSSGKSKDSFGGFGGGSFGGGGAGGSW